MNAVEIKASDVQVIVMHDDELENLGGIASSNTSYTYGCGQTITMGCCY
jgi:hypothetical protein